MGLRVKDTSAAIEWRSRRWNELPNSAATTYQLMINLELNKWQNSASKE